MSTSPALKQVAPRAADDSKQGSAQAVITASYVPDYEGSQLPLIDGFRSSDSNRETRHEVLGKFGVVSRG